ncbi:dTDP-4-dehydrorhamnose 3,5-epimerase [Moritella sp. F3]|uniref:dTDP-4-dehydrorhamnose 3,5-epimerase n=1 Tax=Moritella sp. F3 TaxID=2718882 RepID=UPI0018E1AD7C|nr:dTDP-4-dehydrorhamnose 3,5-epimerase [Moritella sp. F3]GIC77007.1 dTDP-4-dehydrorhamnose 3,5-epimerase [Moritella sp. F1]GIC80189.1 dTDP-4-dehydrorhamnose 3,5-epimerase [Moritella sp. F3]
MKVSKTAIEGALVIQPDVFGDDRGFFMETFQAVRYRDVIGGQFDFVQDNYSRSSKNVLRGLHFQKTNPQGKLVRVVMGEVFDVAVDIRLDSPSYGKWHGVRLNAENKLQFWLPPGLAHGFVVLSDLADFEYKCTDYYDNSDEGCLIWNDPELSINWPCNNPLLSDKDKMGLKFKDLF